MKRRARVSFLLEPLLATAALGPLPLATAVEGLSRQAGLCLPAKWTLPQGGHATLLVEIPRWTAAEDKQALRRLTLAAMNGACLGLGYHGRQGQRDQRPEKEAKPASVRTSETRLEAASPQQPRRGDAATRAWRTGDVVQNGHGIAGETRHDGQSQAATPLAVAIDKLGWKAVAKEPDLYEVACMNGHRRGSRCFIDARARGWLRLSQPRALLRLEVERAWQAMVLFTLESNARLRLARVSLKRSGHGCARVDWEAVLPAEEPLERQLAEALAATVVAREETRPALGALATQEVSSAYLALRPSLLERATTETVGKERSPLAASGPR